MKQSIHIIKEVIAARRTIKPDHYTGEIIDDHLIESILETANWAPTHGYTEPWRFVVYTGDGLATLGDFLASLDQPDPKAESFNQLRFDRLRERLMKCSHVLGIGMKRGNNPKIPQIEEICSVAMAVQNMWLTAHAMGIGAYWSTGELAFRDETRNFLGLAEGDLSLGFFYMGIPAKEPLAGRRLTGIEEKVVWERGELKTKNLSRFT